jgi:methionyl-tRNA synthetase
LSIEDNKLLDNLKNQVPKLIVDINNQELNNYLKKVITFSFDANKYFNDMQPWSLKKTDVSRMNTILFTIVEQIRNISILLNPIIPIATTKILDSINLENINRTISSISKTNVFDHNAEINKTTILFNKVEDDN